MSARPDFSDGGNFCRDENEMRKCVPAEPATDHQPTHQQPRMTGNVSNASVTSAHGCAANSMLKTVSTNRRQLINWAMLDSGATSHYLMATAPVANKREATSPITIALPNGEKAKSSHICELDLPLLPKAARIAHVAPGLASHSLASVVKLCKAGCKVEFKDIGCEITYRGKTIICGSMCKKSGLWMIPISEKAEHGTPSEEIFNKIFDNVNERVEQLNMCVEMANAMPETTSKEELARHLHQALFSPATATLKQAAKEFESFETFPGLDEETVKKMPVSTTTHKGHFNRVCKGFRFARRDN